MTPVIRPHFCRENKIYMGTLALTVTGVIVPHKPFDTKYVIKSHQKSDEFYCPPGFIVLFRFHKKHFIHLIKFSQ